LLNPSLSLKKGNYKMGMFKKVAKAVGKMGVLPKAIKETKVGKINPNLVGKPKPGVAPVGGKRSLPPMPTKVPATGKPKVALTSGIRTGPMRPGVAPATSKPLVSLPQRPTKPKLGPGVTRDTSKPLRG
jgi:hypothetical protein